VKSQCHPGPDGRAPADFCALIAAGEKKVAALEQGRFDNWQFFLDGVDSSALRGPLHHAKERTCCSAALVNNGMPAKQSPIEGCIRA